MENGRVRKDRASRDQFAFSNSRRLPSGRFRSNPASLPGFLIRMKTFAHLKLAAVSLALALSAHAENWPQWRGPAFNGTSAETGLPATWTKESAKWAAPLPGPSGATPAVWGDSIFVSSPDAEKN